MKRQRRASYDGARYPDLASFLSARRVAGAGLLAGAIASAGCPTPFRLQGDVAVPTETGDTGDRLLGDIADTAVDTRVVLPVEGVRHVVFAEPWGEFDYQIEVLAADARAAEAIVAVEAALLDAVDAFLQGSPVTTYEPGQDLTAVVEALRALVAKTAGIGPERIADLALLVQNYTDVGDIDGDIGVAR